MKSDRSIVRSSESTYMLRFHMVFVCEVVDEENYMKP